MTQGWPVLGQLSGGVIVGGLAVSFRSLRVSFGVQLKGFCIGSLMLWLCRARHEMWPYSPVMSCPFDTLPKYIFRTPTRCFWRVAPIGIWEFHRCRSLDDRVPARAASSRGKLTEMLGEVIQGRLGMIGTPAIHPFSQWKKDATNVGTHSSFL